MEIKTLLDAEDPKEAWCLVKLWYCYIECTLPLTPADLMAMGREFS